MKHYGLDIGTSRTRMLSPQGKLLVDEPTQIIKIGDKNIWGENVNNWLRQHPSDTTKVIYPVKKSVLQSYEPMVDILKSCLNKTHQIWLKPPSVITTISPSSSSAELQALTQALHDAGFGSVKLIPRSVASYLGSQQPFNIPRTTGVVELGAGSSELLLTCYGDILTLKTSITCSGDRLIEDLRRHITKTYRASLAIAEVRSILATTDALMPSPRRQHRSSSHGNTKSLTIQSKDLTSTIQKNLQPLVNLIQGSLSSATARVLTDIMQDGLWIGGGVSNLKGLAPYLSQQCSVPIHLLPFNSTANSQGLIFVQKNYAEYSTSRLAISVSNILN